MKSLISTTLMLLQLACVIPSARAADSPDEAGIRQVLMTTFDKPEARMQVEPIVVQAEHAVAGWIQGERGGRALERLAEEAFDLVLMDIHMPVLDGLGATRAIRKLGGRHLSTPIIAVTAEALPEQIETEIELPGWDEDLLDDLNDSYQRDIARIRQMEGVTFLAA